MSTRDRRASLTLYGHICRDRPYCPQTCSEKGATRFDAELRVCHKMRSQPPERVVESGLHRSDGAIDHLRDLREVEAVHVMQDDHQAMLRAERVDRLQDDATDLGLFGEQGRRAFLIRERVARRV